MKKENKKTKAVGLLHDNGPAMDNLIRGLVAGLLERGHDTYSIGEWLAQTIDATSDTEIN